MRITHFAYRKRRDILMELGEEGNEKTPTVMLL